MLQKHKNSGSTGNSINSYILEANCILYKQDVMDAMLAQASSMADSLVPQVISAVRDSNLNAG